MEKKRIYLSGKISGDDNYARKFADKEKELTEQGFLVFNPAKHPNMFSWEEFMELDLLALKNCDSIYLLSDWKDSRGAKIEYDEAVRLGKEVIYDETHTLNRNINEPAGKSEDEDAKREEWGNPTFFHDFEDGISGEVMEIKSYRYRSRLDDGTLTPWQFTDRKPEKKDFEKTKNHYASLKARGEDWTTPAHDGGASVKLSDKIPKNTRIGYKVFYLKDGKLYPPMVANPGGADTPMGAWIDASAGEVAGHSKTGRPQVEKGGKGTHCSKGTLSYRPGWHLGEVPIARQFEKVNPDNGKKELFPKEFVWAECEYAADIDYQGEAMENGKTESGAFRHAYAGLQKVPENGCYRYRTNPDPNTEEWIITGKIKVNRILSDKEVDEICRKAGREPQKRESDWLEQRRKKGESRTMNPESEDGRSR